MLGTALVVLVRWTSFLMVIFTFKPAKVEVWFQLECAPEPGLYIYICHVFPVVSELVYLLLEHVVINDDLEFCLWEMLQQGGSWLF